MTLILGLRCSDGIVMASDGEVTFTTSAGQMTQPGEKIRLLGDHILWAVSGDVGLTQKIEAYLAKVQPEQFKKDPNELRLALKPSINSLQKAAIEGYVAVDPRRYPPPVAHVIFAGCYKGNPWLLEFDPAGTDTSLETFGYAAAGIADHLAHAGMIHYRQVPRDLRLGKVLGYRIIHDAITAGIQGVGPPIHLWEIPKAGKCRKIEGPECQMVQDTCGVWIQMQIGQFGGLHAAQPPA